MSTGRYARGVDATDDVLSALTSAEGQRAVASSDTGAVVRVVRRRLGVKQVDLARRSGWSQPTISRVEKGLNRDPAVLADLADALGIPHSIFSDLASGSMPSSVDDMDRRGFLESVTAVAALAMLPPSLTDLASGTRIGASTVRQSWATLARLDQLDATHGGGAVYELTTSVAKQLIEALGSANYGTAIGRELRGVASASAVKAGWRAYDSGRSEAARRWWLETLRLHELGSGAEEARLRALAAMSKDASDQGNGRDGIALAQAAAKVGANLGSPAMMSFAAAREAIGHASVGDQPKSIRALRRARMLMDRDAAYDRPAWLTFWGPSDIASHEMRCGRLLESPRTSREAARTAADLVTDDTSPRNRAIYDVYLAYELAHAGRLDESIALGTEVLRHTALTGSGRIRVELKATATLLARHDYQHAKDFALTAHRILSAS